MKDTASEDITECQTQLLYMNCEDCKNPSDHFCLTENCRKFTCGKCKTKHGGHFCLSLENVKGRIGEFWDDRNYAKEFLGGEMVGGIENAKQATRGLKKEINELKEKIEKKAKKDYDEITEIINNLDTIERKYENDKIDLDKKSVEVYFKELVEKSEEVKENNKSIKDYVKEGNVEIVEKLLVKILDKAEPKRTDLNDIKNAYEGVQKRADACKKFYSRFDDLTESYLNSVKFEVNLNEAKSKLDEYKDKKLILESKCTTIKSHIDSLTKLSEDYMKNLQKAISEYMKIQGKVLRNTALIDHGVKDKLLQSITILTEEIVAMPRKFNELKFRGEGLDNSYELKSPLMILPFINDKRVPVEELKRADKELQATYSSALKDEEIDYNKWQLDVEEQAWIPMLSTHEQSQYIEFLFEDKFVDWVAIEMKGMKTCWVTRFKVKYWYGNDFVSLEEFGELENRDGENYDQYDDEYDGNIDGDDVLRVDLRVTIRSKGIRIYPVAWMHQIAMKVNALYREV